MTFSSDGGCISKKSRKRESGKRDTSSFVPFDVKNCSPQISLMNADFRMAKFWNDKIYTTLKTYDKTATLCWRGSEI